MGTKTEVARRPPNLLGWYLSDGLNLYWVACHSKHNITLENCYTNLQTVHTYPEFVDMKLKKVFKRGEEVDGSNRAN